MKTSGQQRLQCFLTHIRNLNSDAIRNTWITPKLLNYTVEVQPDVWIAYSNEINTRLFYVWNLVIKRLEKSINDNNFIPLLEDIIFIVDNPDQIELFYVNVDHTHAGLLVLPDLLRNKVRHELISSIDQLFIESTADDFLEKQEDAQLYAWLDEVIRSINVYAQARDIILDINKKCLDFAQADQKNIENNVTLAFSEISNQLTKLLSLQSNEEDPLAMMAHGLMSSLAILSKLHEARAGLNSIELSIKERIPGNTHRYPKSFSRRASIQSQHSASSLPLTTYGKNLSAESINENRLSISSDFEISISVFRPVIAESRNNQLQLRRESIKTEQRLWMMTGFGLPGNLYKAIKSHYSNLVDKISRNRQDDQLEKWERKKTFLHKMLVLSDTQKLSPKTFFDASEKRQDLLFKAFGTSHTREIWEQIYHFLKNSLWIKCCEQSDKEAVYFKLIDNNIIQELEQKFNAFSMPDERINYSSFPEDSRDRWHADKYHALKDILELHHKNRLEPKHFSHVKKTYLCLAKVSFSPFFKSVTQTVIEQAKQHLGDLVWIEAGGEGSLKRLEFKQKQGSPK